jgi:uncharacterized protein (TIGR02147 family)
MNKQNKIKMLNKSLDSVFFFQNSIDFLRKKLKLMGRGSQSRLAIRLKCSSVFISQLLSGARLLSSEQALEVCDFFSFTEKESHYFIKLVEYDRAGTKNLKNFIKKEIAQLSEEFQKISSRVPIDKDLPDSDHALLSSDWLYSVVRLLSSVEGFQTIEKIAQVLNTDREKITQIVDFLLERGLCVRTDIGIDIGPRATHLKPDSSLARVRRTTWRLKALEHLQNDKIRQSELGDIFYSGVSALSYEAVGEIKKEVTALIEKYSQTARDSKSETIYLMNLDWLCLVNTENK